MHSLRKLTLAAAVLALGACSSDDLAAPDMDTSLDPVALDARTSDVDAVYEHPAMASLLQMSEMGGAPLSVNRALARTSETLRSHRTIVSGDAKRPARPAFALAEYEAAIPVDVRGTVFVYDDVEGGWVVDESRTGPADGVRFMLRAVDDAGGLTDTEIGHVELRDLTTTSQYRLVTTLRAGSLTVLSFDERASGDVEVDYAYLFAGYITDGTHRIDLSDSYTEQAVGESYRGVETFTWSLRSGASFRGRWVYGETTATDKDWSEVSFDGNTFRFERPFVWYEEGATYGAGPIENLYGNGYHLAVLTHDESTDEVVSITTPAGDPLSAEQVEGLANLQTVVVSIAEMIYIPFWIIESLVGGIVVVQ
jgi:hypothetical protein